MQLPGLELLSEIGLTQYERSALAALAILGVTDAASLCREGGIPTSKIYIAMEKLAGLGLAEVQPTRPKLFAALPTDEVVARVVELARERADRFVLGAEKLRRELAELPLRLEGTRSFVDVALGRESHVRRHLIRLSGARRRLISYLELPDLEAIEEATAQGFPILRRIARNASKAGVEHRVVFGFSRRSATRLLAFLRTQANDLTHLSSVRFSGELGHPFHVMDGELVILPLDHPFVPGGRFASLLLRDADLAGRLSEGFEGLWRKAMHDLGEIDAHPG